ncbi:MAG TPA: hypothetical protein VM120_18225 [Bryobacteraceae bacterium]|nr:hypothetical protein [Bryobacteraceae bacterium]
MSGVLNVNGGYHFTTSRQDTKWDPFVTAGYTLFVRSGAVNGYNYGGGFVYWFKPHAGLRAEFRDQRFPQGSAFPEFRLGFSFR